MFKTSPAQDTTPKIFDYQELVLAPLPPSKCPAVPLTRAALKRKAPPSPLEYSSSSDSDSLSPNSSSWSADVDPKSDDSDDSYSFIDSEADDDNDDDVESGYTTPPPRATLPAVAPVGPVARMPTNPAPVVICDVAAEAAAAAAAAVSAVARSTPVALNPTQMLQVIQGNQTAYLNHKDKVAYNRLENMVDEFLAYQTEQDPTKDWSDCKSWEDTNDGMGCFLSTYLLWAMWKKSSTLGYLTLMAHDMRSAYSEARRRFPSWCDIVNPSQGLQYVKERSVAYTATLKSIKRILIGRLIDVKRANAMFLSDIRRFRDCMPPTATGFRDVALLYTMYETGARGITFTKCFPHEPHYDAETKTYTIYYQAHKRCGGNMAVKACVLSVEASEIFGLYLKTKSTVDWAHPHCMFGLSTTVSISTMIKDLCIRAGYPHRYFSSHSLRAGALTSTICQALLDGSTPGVAQLDAKVLGDFGVNSDAMRSYIRPMADKIRQFIGKVKHMSELTVEQLHPDLVGKLRGPFRKVKMHNGLPQHSKVMGKVRQMVTMLKQDGDQTSAQINTNVKDKAIRDRTHLMALGRRLKRAGLLHDDLWKCAKKMAGGGATNSVVYMQIGTMLRCMVVTKDLTPAMLQEDPPRMPVPSAYLVKHFMLEPVPKKYKQLEQLKPTFDCGSSTDVSFLKQHYDNRRALRAVPVVHVGNKKYEYHLLTNEQLAMIQARERYRTPISPELFEALAKAEDEAYEQESGE